MSEVLTPLLFQLLVDALAERDLTLVDLVEHERPERLHLRLLIQNGLKGLPEA